MVTAGGWRASSGAWERSVYYNCNIELVHAAVVIDRLMAQIGAFFSLLVLLVTSISVFAMQSYVVAQRTREIGIRISLGANRARIVRLTLRRCVAVLTPGIIIGLFVSLSTTQFLSGQLYGVKATDQLTAVIAVIVTVVACLLGSLVPTRRAASVDPAVALRYE